MSIVLSLLFTCWLHLLPAVHSLPCLRLLRSCWWLPTTYPGKACDTLQFHNYFLPHRSQQHTLNTCFSGVTCRILFPLPCSPLFSKPPHTLALTYIFPSNTPCCDVDLHVFGVSMVMELSLYQLRFSFHVCVTCHQPWVWLCVSSAFSRLRNASRCAVTFCVPKKSCKRLQSFFDIDPSLYNSAFVAWNWKRSFFHCERLRAHHHQKR